jgi:predicted MFS family arabinose efflux permease
MAFTAGAVAANIYYCQPVLELMGDDLSIEPSLRGLIPGATLGGFALGLFLLLPLGDRFNRKHLVLLKMLLSVFFLLLVGFAHSLESLLVASFGVGLLSTVPQQLVPFASGLASPEKRGRVVGSVVSGIMLGILLGRTVGGAVAQIYGWRSMYYLAAVFMLLLTAMVAVALPNSRATTTLRYSQLMRSMVPLVLEQPVMRQAMITQALLWACFNAFWANLASLLQDGPFHLGSGWAGAFGLVGAAGALAASAGGRLSDRIGPRAVVGVAILLVVCSFGILLGGAWSLSLLVVGVIVLDLGVQAALVSNQTRAFHLDSSAQGRINTLYMTATFTGGGLGAAVSTWAWAEYGWMGVVVFGAATAALAGVIHIVYCARLPKVALATD